PGKCTSTARRSRVQPRQVRRPSTLSRAQARKPPLPPTRRRPHLPLRRRQSLRLPRAPTTLTRTLQRPLRLLLATKPHRLRLLHLRLRIHRLPRLLRLQRLRMHRLLLLLRQPPPPPASARCVAAVIKATEYASCLECSRSVK
ncbi:hypothetical protein L917_12511, partial [Phytophthora nicotianae]